MVSFTQGIIFFELGLKQHEILDLMTSRTFYLSLYT